MQIAHIPSETGPAVSGTSPRIALLTPYTGGNLGDAAIQDAMIFNLRRRMPGAQFFGITLDGDNFLRQHGEGAFPLMAVSVPLSSGSGKTWAEQTKGSAGFKPQVGYSAPKAWTKPIRRAVRRVPG